MFKPRISFLRQSCRTYQSLLTPLSAQFPRTWNDSYLYNKKTPEKGPYTASEIPIQYRCYLEKNNQICPGVITQLNFSTDLPKDPNDPEWRRKCDKYMSEDGYSQTMGLESAEILSDDTKPKKIITSLEERKYLKFSPWHQVDSRLKRNPNILNPDGDDIYLQKFCESKPESIRQQFKNWEKNCDKHFDQKLDDKKDFVKWNNCDKNIDRKSIPSKDDYERGFDKGHTSFTCDNKNDKNLKSANYDQQIDEIRLTHEEIQALTAESQKLSNHLLQWIERQKQVAELIKEPETVVIQQQDAIEIVPIVKSFLQKLGDLLIKLNKPFMSAKN